MKRYLITAYAFSLPFILLLLVGEEIVFGTPLAVTFAIANIAGVFAYNWPEFSIDLELYK